MSERIQIAYDLDSVRGVRSLAEPFREDGKSYGLLAIADMRDRGQVGLATFIREVAMTTYYDGDSAFYLGVGCGWNASPTEMKGQKIDIKYQKRITGIANSYTKIDEDETLIIDYDSINSELFTDMRPLLEQVRILVGGDPYEQVNAISGALLVVGPLMLQKMEMLRKNGINLGVPTF